MSDTRDPFADLILPGTDAAPGRQIGATPQDLRRALLLLREHFGDRSPAPRTPHERALRAELERIRRLGRFQIPGLSAGADEANRIDREEAELRALLQGVHEDVARRLIYLGADTIPETWGIWGWDADGRPVAISLRGGQVLLLCGRTGMGKTQAVLGLSEMCLGPISGLTSAAQHRRAVLHFHTDPDGVTLPQVLAALQANSRAPDLDLLAEHLGVAGQPIPRLNLAVPTWMMDELLPLLAPYIPLGLRVLPLLLPLGSLGQTALEAALGAESNAAYVRKMLREAVLRGPDLDIAEWKGIIDGATDLDKSARNRAHRRLWVLENIASPPGGPDLWHLIEPGVLTVFYLGGRRLGHDALPMLSMLLSAIAQPSERHGPFQRVVVLDEFNNLEGDRLVWKTLTRAARQIRHQGNILVLAGHDFYGVPDALLGLVTLSAVFSVANPRTWEHLRERLPGYGGWRVEEILGQEAGCALVSPRQCSDRAWAARAQGIYFRPPCCAHGGHTRTEV